MKSTQRELVLCRREEWTSGLYRQLELQADTLVLNVHRHTSGFICLRAIDSSRTGFAWKRIQVGCSLPEGSTLHIYAYASDDPSWGDWLDQMAEDGYLQMRQKLAALFGPAAGHSGDFLANRTGRYLWLMLELVSSGAEDPSIDSVTVWMDGDHMVNYLPAFYQGDDFTERFLSVFNNMHLDMERQINTLPKMLDCAETDESMLRSLSAWVCLDGDLARTEDLRQWIPTALDDYEDMYTVEGVKRTIKRLTGREPVIIEHHDIDPNARTCINPEVNRRLYGDNPFKFFVLLEEDTFPSRDQMEDFLERMRFLIPAGMELELVLLKRSIQLDWHTYLGINSVVGSYVPATIDENTTIHYDTMIGGQNIERL